MKKPIKIMETLFRDASQSKVATRMRLEDMLPIAEKLDKVGYHSGLLPPITHRTASSDIASNIRLTMKPAESSSPLPGQKQL